MKQNIFDLDINKIGNMLQQIISLNKEIIEKFEQEKQKNEIMSIKILSMDEIIEILNICLNTAYEYIRKGILPKRKIGSRHYFYEQDIHDALQKKQVIKRTGRKSGT